MEKQFKKMLRETEFWWFYGWAVCGVVQIETKNDVNDVTAVYVVGNALIKCKLVESVQKSSIVWLLRVGFIYDCTKSYHNHIHMVDFNRLLHT